MANYTAINLEKYRAAKEGGVIGAKEQEPRMSPVGPKPIEIPHEHVEIKLDPVVAAAGVETRPESIDPKHLEGTPAAAAPSTSHFKEAQPLSDQELKKRAKPLKLFWEYLFTRKKDTQTGEVWGDVVEVKDFAKKEHRKKKPEHEVNPTAANEEAA